MRRKPVVSNTTIALLFTAIALIIIGVILEIPSVGNGSGIIYVVALVYAYTVAKREAALLSYAVKNRDADNG